MNNFVTGAIFFVVGAAAGAAGTWFFAKKHFEELNQRDIESVKETFTNQTPIDTSLFSPEQDKEIEQISNDFGYSVRTLKACITQWYESSEDDDNDMSDYIWSVHKEATSGRLSDDIRNGIFNVPWFEDEKTQIKQGLTPKDASALSRNKPDLSKYANVLKKKGYTAKYEEKEEDDTDFDPDDENDEEGWVEDYNEVNDVEPRVISPEEFEEENGYEKTCLTYYADEVLTDDMDNIIKDIPFMIGSEEPFKHFDEYEDNMVFVRNDRIKMDFEICKEIQTFEEYCDEHPYVRHRNEDD